MSEQEIEREIQSKGLNAPRLTPADIDAAIVGATFTSLPSGKCVEWGFCGEPDPQGDHYGRN